MTVKPKAQREHRQQLLEKRRRKQQKRESLLATTKVQAPREFSARDLRRNPEKVVEVIFAGQKVAIENQQIQNFQTTYNNIRYSCQIIAAAQKLVVRLLALKQGHFEGRTGAETAILVAELAKRHASWQGNPSQWKPKSHSRSKQMRELIRFLLAKFEVPAFLDRIWTTQTTKDETHTNLFRNAQNWWIAIGQGQNIRKQPGLPFKLTKKMAHAFQFLDSGLEIGEALRFAQVLGLGGDKRLAQAVIESYLGRVDWLRCPGETHSDSDYQKFLESVIRWFVAHPMLDRAHVVPILDYLKHRKFEIQEIGGEPLQPNLTMKGRNPEVLLQEVDRWHNQLNSVKKQKRFAKHWSQPDGIDGLVIREGKKNNYRYYQVVPLLSLQALVKEGRKLNHCVATYVSSCVRNACSIWSVQELERETGAKAFYYYEQPLLSPKPNLQTDYSPLGTIELRHGHKPSVVQFRAKHNREPSLKAFQCMSQWVAKNGLQSRVAMR